MTNQRRIIMTSPSVSKLALPVTQTSASSSITSSNTSSTIPPQNPNLDLFSGTYTDSYSSSSKITTITEPSKLITKEQELADTELLKAAKDKDIEGIEKALLDKADPNAMNEQGETSLYLALSWTSPFEDPDFWDSEQLDKPTQIARMLLEAGARPDAICCKEGDTVFTLAARIGAVSIVEIFLVYFTEVLYKAKAPSHQVAQIYHENVSSALNLAADNLHTDTFEVLLSVYGDVNAPDTFGNTLLIRFVSHFCEQIKQQLINIDSNHPDKIFDTIEAFTTIIELLLKHGANIHAINHAGMTALMLLAKNSEFQMHFSNGHHNNINSQDDIIFALSRIFKLLITHSTKEQIESAIQETSPNLQEYLQGFVEDTFNIIKQYKEKKYLKIIPQLGFADNNISSAIINTSSREILQPLCTSSVPMLPVHSSPLPSPVIQPILTAADIQLLDAAQNKDIEDIRIALTNNANPNAVDSQGNTILHIAADRFLVSRSTYGRRILIYQDTHYDNITKCIEFFKLALTAGTDPSIVNKEGDTALHIVAGNLIGFIYENTINKYIEIFKLVLDTGVNPDAVNKYGQTVLHITVNSCIPADFDEHLLTFIKFLIEAKANPHTKDNENENIICSAVMVNRKFLKFFLDLGVNPNIPGQQNLNVLHHLVLESDGNNYLRYCMLLKARANPEIKCKPGATPLMLAAYRGKNDCVEALLEYGVKLDDYDPYDPRSDPTFSEFSATEICLGKNYPRPALIEAAANANPATVKMLLNSGASINIEAANQFYDAEDYYPEYGATSPLKAALQVLVEDDRHMIGPDTPDHLVYHASKLKKRLNTVKLLLKQGANVHSIDGKNTTALMFLALISTHFTTDMPTKLLERRRTETMLKIFKAVIEYSTKEQIEAVIPEIDPSTNEQIEDTIAKIAPWIYKQLEDFIKDTLEIIAKAQKYRETRHNAMLNRSSTMGKAVRDVKNIFNNNNRVIPIAILNKIDSYDGNLEKIETAAQAKKYLIAQKRVPKANNKPRNEIDKKLQEITLAEAKKYLTEQAGKKYFTRDCLLNN